MLLIPTHLVQTLADYLVTCPYKDVASLINQISRLQAAPSPTPPKPELPQALAAAAAMGE